MDRELLKTVVWVILAIIAGYIIYALKETIIVGLAILGLASAIQLYLKAKAR